MQIKEVSEKTGFSKDTLRWYEKIGLIKLDRKSRTENNYRNYSQQILKRLFLIRQMKSFGFSLDEVEDLLVLEEINEMNCPSVLGIVEPKLKMIEEKITDLQNLRSKLIEAKKKCSGNCIELFEEKVNS
ncbi:MAG: MerR family transcriptional regulator [Cyclobacteriaceae bacterium]